MHSFKLLLRRILCNCAAVMGVLLLPCLVGAQNETSYLQPVEKDFLQRSTSPVSFTLSDAPEASQSSAEPDDYFSNHHSRKHGRPHRWRDLWDGGLEVGLNGSSGSSEDLNLVIGFDAKRTVGLNTVSWDLDYLLQKESSNVTKNRLYSMSRYERDIPNSLWNWFGDAWFEYDEFEDFKSRIGLHVGATNLIAKTKHCTLKGRVGLGTSKKSQGPDTDLKPEGLLGADYELRLTKRQKLKTTVDFYPDIGNVSSYRVNTRASWELLIDEDADLSLSISAFDRYDSTPSPSDSPNKLDYWLSIHWGF